MQPPKPVTPPDAETVEAFMKLFAVHRRRLFQYILALLPNVQDAEEVLQETNIILWRKFHQYQAGTNFLAWAMRVAQLEVLKYRRQQHSRGAMPLDESVMDRLAADAEDNAEELDAVREALQQCLRKLSPPDRKLVDWRYGAGARGKDVAAELGRPANSVYKSLGRIRQMLLECITRTLRLAEWPGGAA